MIELALRSELHARGLRFRLFRPVPGRARRTIDITFPVVKVAVFVDGCFWHGCPLHRTYPTNNAAWWDAKISANILRDRDTDAVLTADGWRVVRVWEHQNPGEAADEICDLVGRRRAGAMDDGGHP